MNKSECIRKALTSAGVPTKQIDAYGGQVVVTCYSEEQARRAANILMAATFRLRGIIKSVDYLTDSGIASRQRAGTVRLVNTEPVWRAFLTVDKKQG